MFAAGRKPKAVLFDLLTALIDSWTLWNEIAGSTADGRRWRQAYLQRTYGAGAYRPYEELVRAAAIDVGLPSALAGQLAERYGELRPWREVRKVLRALAGAVPLGVVTNCSEVLARIAVRVTGTAFNVVVTAERAGFYKPHPRPYALALAELDVAPEDCLFVAGSAYDLPGATGVGMPVFWHDRIGMTAPPDAPRGP